MKKLFILLFLTLKIYCNTAVTENEPNALIDGIVSAITGDLYIQETDIVIQGAEPFVLKRSYISSGGEGTWGFFDHLEAVWHVQDEIIRIPEPNGSVLAYRFHHTNHKKDHKTEHVYFLDTGVTQNGLTNTSKGVISAQTNLKNQYAVRKEHSAFLTVIYPNGTQRTYRDVPHQKKFTLPNFRHSDPHKKKGYLEYHFILISEQLPSGNYIFYNWDHDNRLDFIRTADPSGQRTYAQAHIIFHGKMKVDAHNKKYPENADFDIRTSDGRILNYRYFKDGKHKDKSKWLLHRITTTDSPEANISYSDPQNYRDRMVSSISLPGSRNLGILYYNKGMNNAGEINRDIKKEYDFPCNRVRGLTAPVGGDATLHVTNWFHYYPDHTSVVSIDGNVTNYHWTPDKQLSSITRFIGKQAVYNQERFIWGLRSGVEAANLLCKSFSTHAPLFATRYFYDDIGNVLKQKFYGNLSGQGTPLSLDGQGYPVENGVESQTTSFSYTADERHLLVRREEENGLVKVFDYLPGTNLRTKEFTYDRGQLKSRSFFSYKEGFLIQEITDDGHFPDPNNLSGVHTRLIKNIALRNEDPFYGMPSIIEELYWDGSAERLLKKTAFHYTTGAKIGQKDIYNSEGELCYSLTYKYDEKCRLREETNAIGQVAKTDYDEAGNVSLFQDFGSLVVQTMSYDCSNRLIRKTETADDITHITTHTYDGKNNRTSTTDHFGNTTIYVYDSSNHLRETHTPDKAVIKTVYDPAGREISRTDGNGYTTTTNYNARGKPTLISHPDGTTDTFTYNLDGTLHTHVDQAGIQTSYSYDYLQRCLTKSTSFTQEIYVYDAFNLVSKTDAEGNLTTYTYDGAGRKIAEQTHDRRIEYFYDTLGRVTGVKEGELLAETDYDLLNRPLEERKEDVSGTLLTKVQYDYYDAERTIWISHFIQTFEAREWLHYDAFNRLAKKYDQINHETVIEYDETHINELGQKVLKKILTEQHGLHTIETIYDGMGRLETTLLKDRKGILLHQEVRSYDLNSNLVSITTSIIYPDRSIHPVTVRWEYNSMNRVVKQIEADQKETCFVYENGLLDHTIKPDGVILQNKYNDLGFLQSLFSSDSSIHYTYQYDLNGLITEVTDELTGQTSSRDYDPLGNLTYEKLANGLEVASTYEQGRRKTFSFPHQKSVTFSYDALFLRSICYGPYTHHFHTYDLSSNLLFEESMGGWHITRTYDSASRQLYFKSPYYDQKVTYLFKNIANSKYPDRDVDYRYNDLYQLNQESSFKGYSYSYDSNYNRLSKNRVKCNLNALNQISTIKYDPNGNPKVKDKALYEYDALDRLISVEYPDKLIHFTYDFDHRRLSKTVYELSSRGWEEAFTHYYLYDGRNEIGAFDADGNPLELRILNPTKEAEAGSSVAFELQGQLFVPLHDISGNVAAVVPIETGSLQELKYTAFGEEIPSTDSIPWRFASKRLDTETGLYYYGRRYYDPSLGRWLTPDPSGYDDGMNPYAFVKNDPLTQTDAYGLWTVPIWTPPISITTPWVDENSGQRGAAALHATGEFGLRAGTVLADTGFIVTIPARAGYNWATGSSTFSRDWNNHQRANQEFINAGMNKLYQWIPADRSSEAYQSTRMLVGNGLEIGGYYYGGLGVAKALLPTAKVFGKWTLSSRFALRDSQKLASNSTVKLNRFHQSAQNLSEAGQNNIRILRNWARSKGWEKLPNTHGGPEIWGVHNNGKFSWNLRIKPEGSFRAGLEPGSNIPRFDARLGTNAPFEYINPFTGSIGSKDIGTHIPLE